MAKVFKAVSLKYLSVMKTVGQKNNTFQRNSEVNVSILHSENIPDTPSENNMPCEAGQVSYIPEDLPDIYGSILQDIIIETPIEIPATMTEDNISPQDSAHVPRILGCLKIASKSLAICKHKGLLNEQPIQRMIPEIALSFAGEIRPQVEAIANSLNNHTQLKGKVFYDNFFKAQIAVPRLDQELFGLYTRAKFVVVFLSPTYHGKEWCRLEWSAIYKRKYTGGETNNNTIMFIKVGEFDHKKLALQDNDGYMVLNTTNREEIVKAIVRRWSFCP